MVNHLRFKDKKKHPLPEEYTWLQLCREFHCLPSQLNQEDWRDIADLMAMMEGEAEEARRQREEAMRKHPPPPRRRRRR